MAKRVSVESTAEAYLELLASRGVDYFFGNAGTDFAPLIEAFAKRQTQGQHLPRPLTVPHETVAVAMAHGYTMVTGRPQAVMVHVIVGAANALAGVINAARCQCRCSSPPAATRSPRPACRGSRNRQIHWAQESFDQGGMMREWVKWDYELRNFVQLETVVDRALAITQAEPQGPVYLMLPREVLAEHHDVFEYSESSRAPQPAETVAAPDAIRRAAEILAEARHPLLITKGAGRDPGAVAALVRLAEACGAAVVENSPTYMNFPQDHPLHAGFEVGPHLEAADAIVVVECDAPWFPALQQPRPETRLIQIGVDPLFARYPIRGFGADVALAGAPRLTLAALADAVAGSASTSAAVAARRDRWAELHRRQRESWLAAAKKTEADAPLDMKWVSRCVADVIDDRTIVVNEYDLDHDPGLVPDARHATSARRSPAASAGAWAPRSASSWPKPDHTVICCVGDGSYMFGAPTAAHFVGRAHDLPVLYVVFNNRAWNAVKRAVQSHAPEGWTARTGHMPLSDLEPSPDYELVCQSSGGYGERVEGPAELPAALQRALRAVRDEKRQALLNVVCKKPA